MRCPSEHSGFEDPIAGLAAMIFFQAAQDAAMLRRRNKESLITKDKDVISIDEIVGFCMSEWAIYLADTLNVDIRDVWQWAGTI